MTACKDAKLFLFFLSGSHTCKELKILKGQNYPPLVPLYLMHISLKPTAEFKRRTTFKIIHSKRNCWTIQIQIYYLIFTPYYFIYFFKDKQVKTDTQLYCAIHLQRVIQGLRKYKVGLLLSISLAERVKLESSKGKKKNKKEEKILQKYPI